MDADVLQTFINALNKLEKGHYLDEWWTIWLSHISNELKTCRIFNENRPNLSLVISILYIDSIDIDGVAQECSISSALAM